MKAKHCSLLSKYQFQYFSKVDYPNCDVCVCVKKEEVKNNYKKGGGGKEETKRHSCNQTIKVMYIEIKETTREKKSETENFHDGCK